MVHVDGLAELLAGQLHLCSHTDLFNGCLHVSQLGCPRRSITREQGGSLTLAFLWSPLQTQVASACYKCWLRQPQRLLQIKEKWAYLVSHSRREARVSARGTGGLGKILLWPYLQKNQSAIVGTIFSDDLVEETCHLEGLCPYLLSKTFCRKLRGRS